MVRRPQTIQSKKIWQLGVLHFDGSSLWHYAACTEATLPPYQLLQPSLAALYKRSESTTTETFAAILSLVSSWSSKEFPPFMYDLSGYRKVMPFSAATASSSSLREQQWRRFDHKITWSQDQIWNLSSVHIEKNEPLQFRASQTVVIINSNQDSKGLRNPRSDTYEWLWSTITKKQIFGHSDL